MPKKISAERRREALAIYLEHGPAVAAEQTGIAYGTIGRWAAQDGITYSEAFKKADPEYRARLSLRRARLAERLYMEADELLNQLHAPAVERKAMNVSDGHLQGAHVEVVEVELDKPTFADQRQIVTAVAIAIDKAAALIDGKLDNETETGQPSEAEMRQKYGDELVDNVIELAEARQQSA